ncbi:hypothetical protein Mal4_15480 [Maioricimonas rarisocia]|uniref:Uncharacterized protein n=2 Tax=Maioricimonas rarisocia TaxID=2528026 RepID=A0A517Z428_9PLAN|nr:hypothetical protein Mal4_15480 [Maioricimonas rarisocia]
MRTVSMIVSVVAMAVLAADILGGVHTPLSGPCLLILGAILGHSLWVARQTERQTLVNVMSEFADREMLRQPVILRADKRG